MLHLVEIVEGNSEFNECYFEVKLLGMRVDSYSGPSKGAADWLTRRAEQVEEDALRALKQLGFERKP